MKLPQTALALVIGTSALTQAQAVPLAYSCSLNDYLETGVETSTFLYSEVGESSVFKTEHSEARIYLSEERVLALSLRPAGQTTFDYKYTSVSGYDLPKRLDVVLSDSSESEGYAARLSCIL